MEDMIEVMRVRGKSSSSRKCLETGIKAGKRVGGIVMRLLDLSHRLDFKGHLSFLLYFLQSRCVDSLPCVLECLASGVELADELLEGIVVGSLHSGRTALELWLVEVLQRLLLVLLDGLNVGFSLRLVGQEVRVVDCSLHSAAEVHALSKVQRLQLLNVVARVIEKPLDATMRQLRYKSFPIARSYTSDESMGSCIVLCCRSAML